MAVTEGPLGDLVALIDAAAPTPVVVSGSLPPGGGDLDLVVDDRAAAALRTALDAAGFLNRGKAWVRFAGERAEVVELFSPEDLHIPAGGFDEVVAAGAPLPGCERVLRPAPQHILLILALRSIQHGSKLDERHRDRIDEELARDGSAWDRAAEIAPRWRLASALASTRRGHDAGRSLTEDEQRAGRQEWLGTSADRAPATKRGAIVALSGLDGSGKSTQAVLLRDNLDRIGYDAVIVWSRLEWDTLVQNRVLHLVAAPVKAALGIVGRVRGTKGAPAEPASARDDAGSVTMYRGREDDVGVQLRQQSGVVTGIWVAVVAASHALTTARRLRPHLRAGRIVVCDRYTVDTGVFLRHIYGKDRGFRLANRVLRRLSPSPAVTWFLDVPPDVALSRKQDEFDAEELGELRRLYVETHPTFDGRRLNGALSSAELAELIGRHTWLVLP